MKKTAVSVVIAAYKGEKYIGELLRSLFRQTCLPDEILIGDDSPDDLTVRAINAVIPEMPETVHIDYVKNPSQLGVIQNFSELAQRASGEYIFFCDQDDIWLEHKIETMRHTLEIHPECDLAACDSMRVTADLQPLERMVNPDCVAVNKEEFFRKIWKFSGTFSAHNLVLRNQKNNGVPFPADFGEYHDRWLVLFHGIKNKIVYTDQVLTLYRIHDSNLSAPQVHGYSKNFFQRLREIRMKADEDLNTTLKRCLRYRELLLADISADQIPEENFTYMNKSIAYFQWRVSNRQSRSRLLRIMKAIPHIREYFEYSNGYKSFLRDCIL